MAWSKQSHTKWQVTKHTVAANGLDSLVMAIVPLFNLCISDSCNLIVRPYMSTCTNVATCNTRLYPKVPADFQYHSGNCSSCGETPCETPNVYSIGTLWAYSLDAKPAIKCFAEHTSILCVCKVILILRSVHYKRVMCYR